MKRFQGRVVTPGSITAKALVSHEGLNTLASFQKALQFGDKKATCGDQTYMASRWQEERFACRGRSVPRLAGWCCTVPAL